MSSPYDLVGPVLPQALRLARYQASPTLPQNINDLTSEKDTINKTPSREEERLIMSNASVVTALEDLFSWREKDRTSRTSKLSRIESVRFQRAMYRIWLMSELFGPRRFASRRGGLTNEGFHNLESDLHESLKDQKTFLQQYSSQELFQIHRSARFLILTAAWAYTAEGYNLWVQEECSRNPFGSDPFGSVFLSGDVCWPGIFLFVGPHIILRCHEDATTTHLQVPREHLDVYGPHVQFLTHAFHEIILERLPGVIEPPGYGYVGIILDDINGEQDLCHKCGYDGIRVYARSAKEARLLPGLYNETNWTELKGLINHQTILASTLSRNLVEEPLIQALRGDWSKLLPEVFASKGESPRWPKEHWVCHYCWDWFFWIALWEWRLAEKKRTGERIQTDCRYGYTCEKQCGEEGLAHARQFNHLCRHVDLLPFYLTRVFRTLRPLVIWLLCGLGALLVWGFVIWLFWSLLKWLGGKIPNWLILSVANHLDSKLCKELFSWSLSLLIVRALFGIPYQGVIPLLFLIPFLSLLSVPQHD